VEFEEMIDVLKGKNKAKNFFTRDQLRYLHAIRREEHKVISVLEKLKKSEMFSDFELGFITASIFFEMTLAGELHKFLDVFLKEVEKELDFEKQRKLTLGIV